MDDVAVNGVTIASDEYLRVGIGLLHLYEFCISASLSSFLSKSNGRSDRLRRW
jgi:hypothetical protein